MFTWRLPIMNGAGQITNMGALHIRRGIIPIYQKVLRQESQDWWLELLATTATPLTFFLTFGLGLKGHISDVEGVPYIVFMAPGLISFTILMEAYRTGAWGVWLDRWHQKMIDEYRIKPITTFDIIIGEILGGFTVALIKGAVVLLIIMLLAPVTLNVGYLLTYLAYLFPGSIIFACFGTVVGTLFKKPDNIAQSQTLIITPLLYLGGMFFPRSVFPDWIQPVITWLPTTALFEGGRHAFLSGAMDLRYGVMLMVLSVLSFILATGVFNHQLSE